MSRAWHRQRSAPGGCRGQALRGVAAPGPAPCGWLCSLPGERGVTAWPGLLLINGICWPDLPGEPLGALGAAPHAPLHPPLVHPPVPLLGPGSAEPPEPVLVAPSDPAMLPHLPPCPFPTSFYPIAANLGAAALFFWGGGMLVPSLELPSCPPKPVVLGVPGGAASSCRLDSWQWGSGCPLPLVPTGLPPAPAPSVPAA